ncbi:MAG: protease modulator HflC [Pseudomonadota bacterium]
MRVLSAIFFILLAVAAVGAYFSLFVVHQTKQALVLEFGKPKKMINKPGLKWKIPIAQQVVFFDKRILDLDSEALEAIDKDQKRLIVDAFVRWRITDPLKFYQRVRTEARARNLLANDLESALRNVVGGVKLADIVGDKRDDLMAEITKRVNVAGKDFGLNVVDVRIKRADLPEANSEAIYNRMRTDREQEAQLFRSQGKAAANRIQASADRQATIIIAEAEQQAEQLRGEGDAERNKIFAEAFNRDPEFFAFYRSMQAYEKGLRASDTRLVITPDSPFFQYFKDPTGKGGASAN